MRLTGKFLGALPMILVMIFGLDSLKLPVRSSVLGYLGPRERQGNMSSGDRMFIPSGLSISSQGLISDREPEASDKPDSIHE
jgi:hypothetical protein